MVWVGLRLVKGSAVYRGQFDYYKVTIITICLYCIVLINDKLSIFLKISFCFPLLLLYDSRNIQFNTIV